MASAFKTSWRAGLRERVKAREKSKTQGGEGRGGEVTNTAVLKEALITNYDSLKDEFNELNQNEQKEFLDILGGDLKENFDNGADDLEMYVNCLDDDECGKIVDRILSFLDRVGAD